MHLQNGALPKTPVGHFQSSPGLLAGGQVLAVTTQKPYQATTAAGLDFRPLGIRPQSTPTNYHFWLCQRASLTTVLRQCRSSILTKWNTDV